MPLISAETPPSLAQWSRSTRSLSSLHSRDYDQVQDASSKKSEAREKKGDKNGDKNAAGSTKVRVETIGEREKRSFSVEQEQQQARKEEEEEMRVAEVPLFSGRTANH